MNKIKNLLFIVLGLVALSSCTTTNVESYYSSEIESMITPELNQIATVNVGAEIYSQAIYSRTPTIELLVDQNYKTPKGKYLLLGEAENGELVYQNDYFISAYSMYPQLIETKDGDIITDISPYEIIDEENYKRSYSYGEDSFEQIVIFSGSENNILHLSYREFNSNMARSAYTMDLVYDLNNGNIINVKNASFEIIDFNNEKITYKVLSGF